ncbi:MAG TPA: acyl carrier protein [Polyangiaceae bacterium]|jgi:acyl carrier protein|nr:acyl carrier protein [Polyangiaceae bacterium]
MDLEEVQKKLIDHIEREILLRRTPLAPDEDLLDAGFDSMSLTRTLVFIEDALGVRIPDEDVALEELSTIEKLARFVHGRMAKPT